MIPISDKRYDEWVDVYLSRWMYSTEDVQPNYAESKYHIMCMYN